MSVFENGNCTLCGEPVQGYSSINGKVYCHSDERSCYQKALWKLRERNRKQMSKELIEQAIERLKEIQSEGYFVVRDRVLFSADDDGRAEVVSDDPVYATLLRTIEAQLNILREALTGFVSHVEDGFTDGDVVYCSELSLAKAILGVE